MGRPSFAKSGQSRQRPHRAYRFKLGFHSWAAWVDAAELVTKSRHHAANDEFLRSLLQMNPQMREMMEQHPELRQMLHDDGFMQQSLETFRNPSMMREMLRSTDRAMSHIESVPGGFDALRHMYEELARKENMDPA